MARYLSSAWFDEVARHLSSRPVGDPVIVLGQVVTGTPSGDVAYRVVVGSEGAHLVAGTAPEAQVTFTTDWSTARGVASGELSMRAALGTGRVRVGGEVGLLSRHQEALAGIDPVPPAVREATSWGDDG